MTENKKKIISLTVSALAFGFIMIVLMDGISSFLNLFIGISLANLARLGVKSLL